MMPEEKVGNIFVRYFKDSSKTTKKDAEVKMFKFYGIRRVNRIGEAYYVPSPQLVILPRVRLDGEIYAVMLVYQNALWLAATYGDFDDEYTQWTVIKVGYGATVADVESQLTAFNSFPDSRRCAVL